MPAPIRLTGAAAAALMGVPAGPQRLPAAASATYRELLETAPDAMLVVDESGTVVLANSHAQRLFGYAEQALIGASIEDLVPAAAAEAHRRHRKRFFAAPDNRPMGAGTVLHGRRRDGTEFPAEVSLSALATDAGALAVAAVRDVSERARIASALADAEEKFRSTFHSAGIGMALASLDGGDSEPMIDVNESLSLLTGFHHDELIGMSFTALHHAHWRTAATSALARLLSGERRSLRYEGCLVDAGGVAVWVHITSSLVHNDRGAPQYCLHQVMDLRQRKRLEADLQRMADHDPLTDLFNRRRFLVELEREAHLSGAHGRQGVVMLLDLDHFKYVNDSLGHLAGDKLITRTAAVLRQRLRSSDLLARLGGDEFAAILPGTTVETAQELAAAVLSGIRSELRADADGLTRPITASIGIAPFHRDGHADVTDLLSEADIAMYDAKAAGRDCHALYSGTQERQSQMNLQLNLAHKLRGALANDQLLLEVQPIVSLDGDRRRRYELLLRLRDEGGELLLPGTFLPVAKQFGMACEIDSWVTQRAVELLAEHDGESRNLSLAVNLSAHSLRDDRLLNLIAAELRRAGMDAHRLCFELTETAAIDNIDDARRFADGLREIGCEFALDDFGSGYASFYYLKHLHFDYVKIDGEFIRGLRESQTDQVIVRSVAQMARGLGKKTIAEFVEDEATLELLRRDGIDYAQGFHVGRPTSLSALDG